MKRLFALFTLLAFCLTLPATAFAAGTAGARSAARALTATPRAAAPEGQVLYVGDKQISSTGYWTTDDSGNVTPYTEGDKPSDNYIHYDAGNNVLTLHNATIKTDNYHESVTGSAIGVANTRGDAALTIQLEGQENTLSKTSTGIWVYSSGGTANLTIRSESGGSLDASGSTIQGISVVSTSNDASLTIQNAEVEAAVTSVAGNGVTVQAGVSSNASLSVEGGSLTATGNSDYGAGIRFQFGGADSGSGTPSLTVSENAVVKASGNAGGIANNSSTEVKVEDGGSHNGGIVFNNGTGTVYGAVTLQEDLAIGEGESLTVPDNASLTIPQDEMLTNAGTVTNNGALTNNGTINNSGALENNDTLTNNGTIDNSGTVTNSGTLENTNGTINNSGTLESTGKIDGTAPPSITTPSLDSGTVGTAYTAKLAADNSPTGWSVTVGSLPEGLSLKASTGEIYGTPTTQGKSTFTVKATNSGGSHSKEFTLEIDSVPVTGVSLSKTSTTITAGQTETLTATITPENASNKAVEWSTSDDTVAKVDANGKVTAVAPGTAKITVTTQDGGKTATCEVTVTARTYALSADPAALGFGSVQTGYSQPAAVTVTVKNTGNQALTLTQPTAANFEVGALNTTQLAAGGTATFTVRPKAGLGAGSYSERIAVAGSSSNGGSASVVVTATFKVTQGSGTPTPTPAPTPLEQHALHFNTMGGLPLADVIRGLGAPVELWPYTPVRPGYLFMGWYADEALTQPVGTIVLVEDTTIYAKWAADPAAVQSGSGSGGGTGGGSGSGSKATPTPTPTPTPSPTPTPTPATSWSTGARSSTSTSASWGGSRATTAAPCATW